MATPAESKARASRIFCVVSVIVGLLAVAAHLAFEVSQADLGSDLGLDAPGTRLFLHWASLPVAVLGVCASITAFAVAPSWKLRLGSPLPGFILNGAAIAWWCWALA
jgi:hypothetical protein